MLLTDKQTKWKHYLLGEVKTRRKQEESLIGMCTKSICNVTFANFSATAAFLSRLVAGKPKPLYIRRGADSWELGELLVNCTTVSFVMRRILLPAYVRWVCCVGLKRGFNGFDSPALSSSVALFSQNPSPAINLYVLLHGPSRHKPTA